MPSSTVAPKQTTVKPQRSASSKPVNESVDLKWGDSVIDFEFGKQTMSSPSRESKGQDVDDNRRQNRQSSNPGSFSSNLQKNNNRRQHRSHGSHGSNSKLESKPKEVQLPCNEYQESNHNKAVTEGQPDYCKVFVGGLHYETTVAEFRAYFEKYGKVIFAEVMYARETHKPRGFGFVVFQSEHVAERVCTEGQHVIDGKTVEVKRAVPRPYIRPQQIRYPERRDVPMSSPSPQPVSQPQQTVMPQQQQIQQAAPVSPQVQPHSPVQQQSQVMLQQHHQQLAQHQMQQLQVHHMQQQHAMLHSPQHHHQFTHLQLQQLQQYQLQQQYQHHPHHAYMGPPIIISPMGVPELAYPTDMMDADQAAMCENMEQMHMENTSKSSSLDIVTDVETIANYAGEGGIGKLDMSELTLRDEMCRWFIANVKIVRKVAEKYVTVLYEAEVGSIDRLRKKVTRYPTFLRDLQFDVDDCEDILVALFRAPGSMTGACSPVSSSGASLDGSAGAHYSLEIPHSSNITSNVAASAALAGALLLGNSTNAGTSIADANRG